jgi:hypothetical protein
MKKTLISIALIVAFQCAGFMAQAQPHPGQQNGGGAISGGTIGSSAPTGEGLTILLIAAFVFGLYKLYSVRRQAIGTASEAASV